MHYAVSAVKWYLDLRGSIYCYSGFCHMNFKNAIQNLINNSFYFIGLTRLIEQNNNNSPINTIFK